MKWAARIVLAVAMAAAPMGLGKGGFAPPAAHAGMKSNVGVLAIGVAAHNVSAIQALTLASAISIGGPLYLRNKDELARMVWSHPFVGPPAFVKALSLAKQEGNITEAQAAKLEADVMAAKAHPEAPRPNAPAGFADRPVPKDERPGTDMAPAMPGLPGRNGVDYDLGRVPGLTPHGDAPKAEGLDIHENGGVAHDMPLPDWLVPIIEPGHKFNRDEGRHYAFNEIAVGLYPPKRLDSYVPGEQIVSRKFTQLADVKLSTGAGYIRELYTKYAPGTPILQSKRNIALGLAPGRLEGQLYLDVPVQTRPIPDELLRMAARHRVIIRERAEREVVNDRGS